MHNLENYTFFFFKCNFFEETIHLGAIPCWFKGFFFFPQTWPTLQDEKLQ